MSLFINIDLFWTTGQIAAIFGTMVRAQSPKMSQK